MRAASFDAHGAHAGPITLDVFASERVAATFANGREAHVAALLAAGIAKAMAGSVLIGPYDPRVQAAHCKRIAAFVAHDPLPFTDESEFDRYVEYRAALWDVDPVRAAAHARLVLERLAGVHEAFAYPLAAALAAEPQLLVLDRPLPAYAPQILAAAGPRAVFSTHVDELGARAFASAAIEWVRA
jgi:ABC-type taurine transport system ATPase subunit